jgi:hypothetical protein
VRCSRCSVLPSALTVVLSDDRINDTQGLVEALLLVPAEQSLVVPTDNVSGDMQRAARCWKGGTPWGSAAMPSTGAP